MPMYLLIISSFLFLFLADYSPAQVGAMILALSAIRAFFMSVNRGWFSLILFLIYIGGMLVAFSYLMALCPNMCRSNAISICGIVGVLLTVSFFVAPLGLVSGELSEVRDIYNPANLPILTFSGVLLLVAIVAVVKIVERIFGALRPLNSNNCGAGGSQK